MEKFIEKSQKYIEQIEFTLNSLIEEQSQCEKVADAMVYSLLSGGKRIRGIIVLSCYEMFEGDIEEALKAAVAVELVHAYSLIHDDLPCMDNDSLRRGKPSCHIAFTESIALLAGDALLTLAFNVLTEIKDETKALMCIKLLSEAAGYRGMIRGQELDLISEGKSDLNLEDIELIHKLKTGKMYIAAALMGLSLAGASESDLEAAKEAFSNIGLVFQIIDDILDTVSDEKTLGKPINSDKENKKNTYLSVYSIETAREIAKELTDRAVELLIKQFSEKAWFICELAKNLLVRIK